MSLCLKIYLKNANSKQEKNLQKKLNKKKVNFIKI